MAKLSGGSVEVVYIPEAFCRDTTVGPMQVRDGAMVSQRCDFHKSGEVVVAGAGRIDCRGCSAHPQGFRFEIK